jgi:signal peptidase I
LFSKEKQQRKPHSGLKAVCVTLDWITTAFVLTLVFIVFEMQAYTIPTGSMADTLMGAHFRLRCGQCGQDYNYGFIPQQYGFGENVAPGFNVPVKQPGPMCPACGYTLPPQDPMPVTKGDRIFVNKCIYQFIEPKRWDVVVFNSPLQPHINYIKRLIALPSETVEIIDGDIYVDGQIEAKPINVQRELWMPVYNNEYLPVNPAAGQFIDGHMWKQPFINAEGSGWQLNADGAKKFVLDGSDDKINIIEYNAGVRDFKAFCSHNDSRMLSSMPPCSDLMVRFYCSSESAEGKIGASLSKYATWYTATVDLAGGMVIEKTENGKTVPLAKKTIAIPDGNGAVYFEFANVDHQLVLRFGDEKLKYELGRLLQDVGPMGVSVSPHVSILGAGSLELSEVAIFKDIHYVSLRSKDGLKIQRAGYGNPFQLGTDEFFVLGDNTANSADSRFWERPGSGNNDVQYSMGTVPRDYLVGKAFFVYWPGAFVPFNDSKLAKFLAKSRGGSLLKMALNVPCTRRMKLIYGSSGREY